MKLCKRLWGKREDFYFPCMRYGKENILKTSQRLFQKKSEWKLILSVFKYPYIKRWKYLRLKDSPFLQRKVK